MDVFPPTSSAQVDLLKSVPGADPRLQPTPDYGTLGPGSDIRADGPSASSAPGTGGGASAARAALAIAIGVFLAGLAVGVGSFRATRSRPAGSLSSSPPRESAPASTRGLRQLDRMQPQKQAETLLELAIGHSDGAVDEIATRADRWRGKLTWDSQIATLTTAALNSNDMGVRNSGIEVELAAYGLAPNSASLDYVLKAVDSPDRTQKIWALWALGLLGNRGVETSRVVEVLTAHLKDSDEDSRRWAVESLALVGTSETISILLEAMHDDPAPSVRERAACGLAESGMFTPDERMSAVPQLLNYTDDPSLDAQTHAWAFQALADITHQRLPNDSATWRSWYENRRGQ